MPGTHIDPPGGLVEEEHLAVALEPLGEHHLLLVSAREIPGPLVLMRHLDAKLVDVPAEGFPLAATIHESKPRERAKVWQCKILTDRLAEHEPLQFAVFREQADAGRDGVAGRTDVE